MSFLSFFEQLTAATQELGEHTDTRCYNQSTHTHGKV